MEALQVYNFRIKSIIHDYSVEFIEDFVSILKKEVKSGDVFIFDNKIKELYPQVVDSVKNDNLFIEIKATESNKSYEGLIPIINKLIAKDSKKPSFNRYRRWHYSGYYCLYSFNNVSRCRVVVSYNPSCSRRQLYWK